MLLSSGFIVASLGADLKNRRGRRRRWAFSAPPFFFFLLLHSLFIGLSICVCLIEPSWCLLDELIPWLRFWSPFLNKRLDLWIGHMALVGGLWSIHSHFECICTSYRASTGQADLPPLSAATWAIFISITHQSSGHLWIPERTHNTHTHAVNLYFPCLCLSLCPQDNTAFFGKEPAPLISIRSCRQSCSGDGYFSGPSCTFPRERRGARSTALQPGSQMYPVGEPVDFKMHDIQCQQKLLHSTWTQMFKWLTSSTPQSLWGSIIISSYYWNKCCLIPQSFI